MDVQDGEPVLTLIALEGVDKSGKETQTGILIQRLREMGRAVEEIAFPDYNTVIGRLIKRYLDGEVSLRPEIRQLLFVANRWERCRDLRLWLGQGKIVVADRYIPSGLVYGLANGLDLEWMINLEKGLPTSDLVIIIDILIDTVFEREENRDVYEEDRGFLERVRAAYHDLSKRFGWIIVNGEKTMEDVSEEIWRHVSKII